MSLKYKPDFDNTKKYLDAFWNHEIIDRPCICVTSPKAGMIQKPTAPYMGGCNGEYELALKIYEEWADTTYFGGEAVPYFDVSFGADQFSAFLGAELTMGKDKLTSWVNPFVTDWGKFALSVKEDKDSSFGKMLSFLRFAAEYSEGKFLVSMLDLHSNMDCLSAIRGPGNLCMDLYDCPDEIDMVLNKVRKLYVPIYEKIFEAGNMSRGTIGWAPMYSEGRSAVIQCDFSCMISPQDARKFVIPCIEEEASYLDHSVYHYDGKEALGHLEDILAIPKIDVIQWVPGAGQPRTFEWMELLKKIQKAGKGLWIYDWTIDEIKQYNKELRPEGLIYQVEASSQQEAEDLIIWLKNNT